MESDTNVLQYLIRHVFLPPQLPQESESDGSRMDHRLLLQAEKASRRFIELLRASDESTSIGAIANWERASKMLREMSNLHQGQFLTKQELVPAFKRMGTGGKYSTPLRHPTNVPLRCSPLIYCIAECRRHIPQAGPRSYDL
jgi:hypothetical protein